MQNINLKAWVPLPKKTKAKIKFSNKSFVDFLHHPVDDSFFIKARNSDEIKNIISKLNKSKSTGSKFTH